MDCLPQLHLAAVHAAPGYRGETPGVGVLCRQGDALIGAGGYSNSINRHSNYAALGWQPWRIGAARVGAVAGAVTGYRNHATPLAAGFISVGSVNLTVVPPVPHVTPLTVGVSYTFSLKDHD